MSLHPTLVLGALSLLSAPLTSQADSICDPGSFISSELRVRWCGEHLSQPQRAPKVSKEKVNRKPQSEDEDEEEDDEISAPAPVAQKQAARKQEEAQKQAARKQEDDQRVSQSTGQTPTRSEIDSGVGCSMKKLRFSADRLPQIPGMGEHLVWGANATNGNHVISPPFSSEFLRATESARKNGIEVFAYLEGPCGDTNGVDDGEKARCRALHNAYNAKFAPSTPNTDIARWKPYTFAQLKLSGKYQIGYCEIDNLSNNVTVPLVPLMKELKNLFDSNQMYCRIVLKNLSAGDLAAIKKNVAPSPADAAFIAPFHIYEDDNNGKRDSLTAAMQSLKGQGSTTIISTDSNRYGSRFTQNTFLTCGK